VNPCNYAGVDGSLSSNSRSENILFESALRFLKGARKACDIMSKRLVLPAMDEVASEGESGKG
jgi:hypothetical protein